MDVSVGVVCAADRAASARKKPSTFMWQQKEAETADMAVLLVAVVKSRAEAKTEEHDGATTLDCANEPTAAAQRPVVLDHGAALP